MRDPGLDKAIRAAGGVGALARKIGISQPSVSNWERVPAERVLAVEAATGIGRAVLRPDLYQLPPADRALSLGAVDDADVARAQEYGLLAVLLGRAPSADLLGQLAALRGDASPLGRAHLSLAAAAAIADPGRVEREFFNLFIGIGRGELLPYGSYYRSGFLHERPLAQLRADLARLGIARVAGHAEPEDHAAVLCDIMAGLAAGRLDAPPGADRDVFEKHLAPWAGGFFADLERAAAADFYRRVGTVGRLFMAIESEAFALAA
jgi:TorA maturation chaperone TorD